MKNAGSGGVWAVARWEFRNSLSGIRRCLSLSVILLIFLLILVSGLVTSGDLHLQDGIYHICTDCAEVPLTDSDARFETLISDERPAEISIDEGVVSVADSAKGSAALAALIQDCHQYRISVYNTEDDLFAAYPLWIERVHLRSELDFHDTAGGQRVGVYTGGAAEGGYPGLSGSVSSEEELREGIIRSQEENRPLRRYADLLIRRDPADNVRTPAGLMPALPYDSIIIALLFVFPLCFCSQFFMKSIMNERIGRRGEVLLSTPLRPWQIITGKALPCFLLMLAVPAVIISVLGASFFILLPLLPVIIFLLANALVIGMVARSFRELSLISTFFTTSVVLYLFLPSIFAGVHVISLISPLTLIIQYLEGTDVTFSGYLYSTSLLWLTSAVLFYIAVMNFNTERLFSYRPLFPRIREFIYSGLRQDHLWLSLFAAGALSIPFVLMVQMMGLVFFFNLPMPLSVIMLLFFAAFVEESAKSLGIYAIFWHRPSLLTWRSLPVLCLAVALGFLAGEKLLMFATIAGVTGTAFGQVLFMGGSLLMLPLAIHFAGIIITAGVLKLGGRRACLPGVFIATLAHSLYNLWFVTGGLL